MAEPHETAGGQKELLTEELLQRLLASATPEAYLGQGVTDDRSVTEYLQYLLDKRGLTRADVARGSGVNATFVYHIFDGDRSMGRDTALKIAFGLRCSLRETQRLLRHAGLSELWCKNRRDAIIIHCVEQGLDRARTDDELYRLGEETLVPREG